MLVMIYSKYGYELFEWVQVDVWLDKWCKNRKCCVKQYGVFCLDKNKEVQYVSIKEVSSY